MTDDVRQLIANWEALADVYAATSAAISGVTAAGVLSRCANELEAVLRASVDPPAKAVGVVVDIESDAVAYITHAASLREQSLGEYIKRAVNAALRKQGVDAVLIAESDDPPALRASVDVPAPEKHRCVGCGHRWDGPLSGAELCGDCWRKVQPTLQPSAVVDVPAPTPSVMANIYNVARRARMQHSKHSGGVHHCTCNERNVSEALDLIEKMASSAVVDVPAPQLPLQRHMMQTMVGNWEKAVLDDDVARLEQALLRASGVRTEP